jgi:hypothetical protein
MTEQDQAIPQDAAPEDLQRLLPQGPRLTFEHVASVQEVSFHEHWLRTLQQAWDRAYVELGEERKAEDRLLNMDGNDMSPYLSETILQLFSRKKTRTHKFQILGPTGGALE